MTNALGRERVANIPKKTVVNCVYSRRSNGCSAPRIAICSYCGWRQKVKKILCCAKCRRVDNNPVLVLTAQQREEASLTESKGEFAGVHRLGSSLVRKRGLYKGKAANPCPCDSESANDDWWR